MYYNPLTIAYPLKIFHPDPFIKAYREGGFYKPTTGRHINFI